MADLADSYHTEWDFQLPWSGLNLRKLRKGCATKELHKSVSDLCPPTVSSERGHVLPLSKVKWALRGKKCLFSSSSSFPV